MLQQRGLDVAYHALADPTRRRLVERLTRGPASVTDLARPLPMTMSAVVQHLKVLQDAGLVASEKVGRVRTCRLQTEALGNAERWLTDRRLTAEAALDRLGDYLDATGPDTET